MIFLYKKIFYFFDNSLIYTRVLPLNYPAKVTFLNLINNFLINFLNIFRLTCGFQNCINSIKETTRVLIILISFITIQILKIFYLPLIVFFYFSKYRFTQINHYQLGTLCEDLNRQVKKNYIKGYKSIILIPKFSKFSFVKKIFKKLIIIDNNFLNIILLPLKHTGLISCKFEETNPDFNRNLDYKTPNPRIRTIIEYRKKFGFKNIYIFKNNFIKEMKLYLKNQYPNLNFSKLIVFHHREKFYNKTSGMRGSNLETYRPGIKYLLRKNYSVIRLTHSHSNKLKFENNKYLEINTDLKINQLLQFYILSKCKGLLCSDSGPSNLAPIFNLPCFESNIPTLNVNGVNKKSLYILKKIKLKNKIMPYNEIFKIPNYFQGLIYSKKWSELGFELLDNTENEILEGIKEFIKLIQNTKPVITKDQAKFNRLIPYHTDIKLTGSKISKYFIKNNSELFKDI